MATNDGVMLKALNEIASDIVEQAKRNASFSQDIPNAISFEPATVTNNGFEVTLKVDSSEDGPAPHAAAFEFGSGIHRTRGTPGTYKIKPKEKKALAFPWNPANPIGAMNSPKVIDYLEDEEIWLFREVDHPGVEQRAYMTPAIQQKIPEAEQKLNKAIRVLLSFGNKVEVIK